MFWGYFESNKNDDVVKKIGELKLKENWDKDRPKKEWSEFIIRVWEHVV